MTNFNRYQSCHLIFLSLIVFFLINACNTSYTEQKTALASTSDKKDQPYNFVVLFADDLGYGDLGIYGHPTIQTPNLDRMAMEGQKWTNFYVGASVCTPSRAALLTGRLPIRSGMAGAAPLRVLFPNSERGLPASEVTLAEQLKTAGYATACVGKWHLGHREAYLPTNHGFDYYYGIPYSNDMDNLAIANIKSYSDYWTFWQTAPERKITETFNVPIIRNLKEIKRPANQHTITKDYTKESIDFIKKSKDQPFFLYLAYSLPHIPLFASKDFEGKSKRGLYGDTVEEIDWSAGQIMEMLKAEGLAENTIVVFTSDNGAWLQMSAEGGSNGLLREGKGATWEGGMREPGIFWSPGNIQPKVVTDMGTTMDLFTTFSKLAKVDLPTDRIVDGVDLSPVLFEGKPSPRNEVFYYRGRELFAVRVGPYKAHFMTQASYTPEPPQTQSTPLLFNVEEDPSEQYNIADKHPDILVQIKEVVKAHQEKLDRTVVGVFDGHGPHGEQVSGMLSRALLAAVLDTA
ncbi:MAG: sulfatase, partial [Bacteroidota bacterium]